MNSAAAADQIRRNVAAALVDAAARCGEHLLGEAQRRAPVDEGTLRASGTLAYEVDGVPVSDRSQAELAAYAAIKANGTATVQAVVRFETPYAARQHEELGWQHPKGGEAKYLEGPLHANAGRYATIVAKATQAAWSTHDR